MGDYDPFANRNVKYPTSNFETLVHLVKGVCGSGVLTMPLAFKNIGIWAGLIGIIIIGIIQTHCLDVIVRCSHILCTRFKVPSMTVDELAYHAFLDGPPALQRCANCVLCVGRVCIALMQLGCIIVYTIIMARCLEQIIKYETNDQNAISVQLCIIICTIPLILMCLVKNLKFITPFSLIANILSFGTFALSTYFLFSDLPPLSSRPAIAPFDTWPLFFGTAAFAVAGIGPIMSIENNMKNPQDLLGLFGVLVLGMIICVIIALFLGFFGYWRYGEAILGNYMLNLPLDNKLAYGLKISISISIFLTSTIQFHPAIAAVWTPIKDKIPEERQNFFNYILRILLIVFCSGIAIVLPNVGPMTSIIGCVCLTGLGVLLPVIAEMIVYRNDPGYGFLKWRIIKNFFVFLFGIVGLVTGLYVSILEFTKDKPSGD